uniref:Translation initiation factor eIF2B subunit beta n=1 Tax=Spongospora subterranea TaxID=70186 RepID=A0A0H5RBJ3_9EUKA|eukprot:CRZ10997.1 hypothetical protein [Spongospora subterranea]
MADSPAILHFAELLRSAKLNGSLELSKRTVNVLSKVVRDCNVNSVEGLIDLVRSSGNVLIRSRPQELVIGNIVRRFLSIIRGIALENGPDDPTIYGTSDEHLMALVNSEMRETISLEIAELFGEIDLTLTNITQYAVDHIHSNEVILTFGESSSVSAFLIAGGSSRNISVIVAESGPKKYGYTMCQQLAKHGIQTTLIPDSHVYAVMPSVNKVVFGTQAVLADGGLLGFTGSHNIAACARSHAVPVIVVAGIYKFSPLYAFNQDTLNAHNKPSDILSYEDKCSTQVHIYNPAFDYVPSTYIALFVTNVGPYHPSYIYRLLSEVYNQADLDL